MSSLRALLEVLTVSTVHNLQMKDLPSTLWK